MIILLTLMLAIAIGLIVNFPVAFVLLLLYKWVILAIFPALPILTFWQMYGITIILSVVGSFFRSTVTVKKN